MTRDACKFLNIPTYTQIGIDHLFAQHDRYVKAGGWFEFERWLRFCFAEYGDYDETAHAFQAPADNPHEWTIAGKVLRSFTHDYAHAIDGTHFARVGGGFGVPTLWQEEAE